MRNIVYAVWLLVMMSVSVGYAQPAFEHRSLEEALNPDGTLKRGVQGSFSVKGYTMRAGANGEPIFLPQTQNTENGTWDTQFGLPNGVFGPVYALAFDGQGNVYVGGSFDVVSGVSTLVNRIARYNIATNTWHTLGTGAQNGVNGFVYALAVDGSGGVYVGGVFTQAGGVSANNVARFDPATNSWSALGTGAQNGVNDFVYALAIDGSGGVYVGGNFTQAGGVSANRVARFDPATNTWSAFGTGAQNGVNSSVLVLAVDGSGGVYVGGNFTQAGGGSANHVARYNPQDSTWSALGTGAQNGVNDGVSALAIDGSGRVVVGGRFTQAGGGSANHVARFDPATNTWSALGTGAQNGVSNSVVALAIDGSGRVYVGGFFTQAGGVASSYIARFTPANAAATQTVSADGLFNFLPTGVGINFTGVSGTGTCTVARYDAPASNVSFTGTPPASTSLYRLVITASGFTFSQAELRINRTQLPLNGGIANPQTVRVYRRPTPGSGAFSILPNTFNPSFPDEVRATTTAFSEFILGSDDASNVLPVELTEFTGRKTESGVELVWKTATELNNAGFEVERKSQGAEWNTLGFVRGRGTTTEAQSYSFLDRTATGKVQYRLKQIDFDGQFEYSNIIEVDAGLPKVFALEQNYPNPFNPTTVISYQLPVASEVSLKVYDMLGREVMTLVNGKQEAGAYNFTLNATGLASGIYFYRLQASATNGASSSNFVETKKMMLVK